MTNYILSPRARSDLQEIWNYTERNWGIGQAKTYVRTIESAIEVIAGNPEIGKSCDEIRPGYRKFPAGSHLLFYRLKRQRVDVVRILHQRMDHEQHL